jgi:hypothetical protein
MGRCNGRAGVTGGRVGVPAHYDGREPGGLV